MNRPTHRVPLSAFTVHLPLTTGERIKNAAAAMNQSTADFCRLAVLHRLDQAEMDFNQGQPFPGRPVFTQGRS